MLSDMGRGGQLGLRQGAGGELVHLAMFAKRDSPDLLGTKERQGQEPDNTLLL